jgi:hypothetical protein
VTHARLRAAQGDLAGARRVLRSILASDSGNDEARRLLGELDRLAERDHAEPEAAAPAPPVPGSTASLAGRFRAALGRRVAGREGSRARAAARLRRLLARIERRD